MSDFNKPWFFAGGWAIDLFMEKENRQHCDVEIAIFREDQFHLKEYLKGWEFNKVVNGKFHPWENGFLKLPIHELYAINSYSGCELEILLNEKEENEWRFRRDLEVTLPIESVWSYTDDGIPYLNPGIVLLYKTKDARKKDFQDFIAVKDYLGDNEKRWLQNIIKIQCPGHKWIQYLT